MDRSRFLELIDGFADANRSGPLAYRRRVKRFLRLGYAAYYGHMSLILAAFVTMVVVVVQIGGAVGLLTVPIAAAAWVVARSFFVKLDAPQGLLIDPSDAPGLYECVRSVGEKLGGQVDGGVLINPGFNASASSTFRFATFSPRTYVCLGVQLLLFLDPEEATAVIAHEVAHHCRRDVVFGAREARLRQMWAAILDRGRSGYAGAPIRPFLEWYLPRLEAMTTVLSRVSELEADALAAATVGKDAAVRTLVKTRGGRPLWSDRAIDAALQAGAVGDSPPKDVFYRLAAWPQPTVDDLVRHAVESEPLASGPYDSHPSLAERLRAIDDAFEPATEAGREWIARACHSSTDASAFQAWFSEDARKRVLDSLSDEFARSREQDWADVRHRRLEDERLLAGTDPDRPTAGLSASELWQLARAVARLHGLERARAWAEAALAADPASVEGRFALGTLFAKLGDDRCVGLLESTADEDTFETASLAGLATFYAGTGDWQTHAKVLAKLESSSEIDEEIEHWLALPANDGHNRPVILDGQDRAALVTALRKDDEVLSASLVKRTHPSRPLRQRHVLVVVFRPRGLHLDPTKTIPSKYAALQKELPIPDDWVVQVSLPSAPLARAVSLVPGSELYRRS